MFRSFSCCLFLPSPLGNEKIMHHRPVPISTRLHPYPHPYPLPPTLPPAPTANFNLTERNNKRDLTCILFLINQKMYFCLIYFWSLVEIFPRSEKSNRHTGSISDVITDEYYRRVLSNYLPVSQ